MTISTLASEHVKQVVEQVVKQHGCSRDEIIPILSDVNRQLGYLPAAALEEISVQLKVPTSQLFSVASFYRMLSTKPHGRHVIRFCESAPCHVVGGRHIWMELKAQLKLKNGETSPDGRWTLETTSCLGICGVGPVIMVDDDVYGNVTPDQVTEILARYE